MSSGTDRDLLFGLIALQNGLIDRADLVAAFRAWALDRSIAMADHLASRGFLDADDRAAVEALVGRHLEKNGGDPGGSLAPITAGLSTREGLAALGSDELTASLGQLGARSTEPGRTSLGDRGPSFTVATSTSEGQRYRVLRLHARGGLGAVFVAIDSELNREVALKQILDGLADDPASRQRFLMEAEITGGLEHPGIVPVYGLGAHADGRPYYAMRFIRGDSLKGAIDAFHNDESLRSDPGRRSLERHKLLRRFTDVCNAIEYAHSRGVLHRDIKPGNVIVGKHGETLVVDWGLAKPLGRAEPSAEGPERILWPSSASGSAETLPGQALGTPAYMSPEQARGDLGALGPRSDVYSLGATLYCLLAGKAPFEGPVARVLHAVGRGEFAAPRTADPSIDPALEAVCLKAMATRPEARYASCLALAGDVERWLADEPVSAYREPAPARVLRWARRHRPLVAGLAATLLAAVVALGVGTFLIGRQKTEALRQRDRAEDNLALARQVVDEMYTQAASRLVDRKGMDSEQRDLLVKAARFYERFALPQSADPPVQIEAARAGLRAGDILAKLGQAGPSEESYGRAMRLMEALAAEGPADLGARRALADGHYRLARLFRDVGRKVEAETSYRRAADIQGQLAAAEPGAAEPRQGIARALLGLGAIEADLGRHAASEDFFRKALARLDDLTRDYPGVAEYRSDRANTWNSLADLQRHLGRAADAMASWERAFRESEALARDHPQVGGYRAALARTAHNLGTIRGESGRTAQAMESYRTAAKLREALVDDHPDVPDYRDELAGTYNNLGNLLRNAGKLDQARPAFEKALVIKDRLARDHPEVVEYRSSLALGLTNFGFLLSQVGRDAEALPLVERAAALQEGLVRDHPEVVSFRRGLAASLSGLGGFQRQAGKADEALKTFRRALGLWESVPLGPPSDVYNLACVHAQCMGLIASGNPNPSEAEEAERESHADRAMDALRRAVAAGFSAPGWLRQDPDLAPLRSRADFRELLMDLDFPADPFDARAPSP